MALVRTPAVLLKGMDYGDSSRILRFYTREHGLLSVVARGVRGGTGKGGSAMTSFASGDLSAYVKASGDLHTLRDFHPEHPRSRIPLDLLRFAGAACLAELMLAHVEQEANADLFYRLENELDRLDVADGAELPAAILSALWRITSAFGFNPALEMCVRCGRPSDHDEIGRFDLVAGGVACGSCADAVDGPRIGPLARAQLSSLIAGVYPTELLYPRRHLTVLGEFLAHHVLTRPLKTLTFLADRLPEESGVTRS